MFCIRTWWVCVIVLAAGGCRRTAPAAGADAAGPGTPPGALDGTAGTTEPPADAAPAGDAAANTPPADAGAADDTAPAESPADAASTAETAAQAPPTLHADPAAADEPFCPTPLAAARELYDTLWPTLAGKLAAHHGVRPGVLEEWGPFLSVRAVRSGPGQVLVIAAYAVDRFALWRGAIPREDWPAVEARVRAARERLHTECLARPPGWTDDPREDCAPWLDEETDPSSVEKVWEGIAPVAPISDCVSDALEVASFTGRLDEQGGLDLASLQLEHVASAKIESRCNPEANDAQIVDVDHDGALEFVFTSGPGEEETQAWVRQPIDLTVLRLDLSLQHHQQFPGVQVSDEYREGRIVPQLRFWFEDRTGDGHPDVVVETFEYAGDCYRDPVPDRSLAGCGPAETPEVDGTIEDFPECERRHDEVELRRAYVPERDGWLAPPS